MRTISILILALLLLSPSVLAVDNRIIFDARYFEPYLYALSERGRLFRLKDGEQEWKELALPREISLTRIARQSDSVLWVVGHDASLFKTEDFGSQWTEVQWMPESDAPLFDILFVDDQIGFAVGAYGLFFETRNGGRLWERREIDEDSPHLYSIQKLSDGSLFITAEFGGLLRSSDRGLTWESVVSPYEGSLFGSMERGAEFFVFGLRSRLFKSEGVIFDWGRVESEGSASWMGACQGTNGFSFLFGLAGQILWSSQSDSTWKFHRLAGRPAVSSMVCDHPSGDIFAFGDHGKRILKLDAGKLVERGKP